jgi:hypothetical protein
MIHLYARRLVTVLSVLLLLAVVAFAVLRSA